MLESLSEEKELLNSALTPESVTKVIDFVFDRRGDRKFEAYENHGVILLSNICESLLGTAFEPLVRENLKNRFQRELGCTGDNISHAIEREKVRMSPLFLQIFSAAQSDDVAYSNSLAKGPRAQA